MTVDYAKAKRWMSKELKLLREHMGRLHAEGFADARRARIAAYVAGEAQIGAAIVGLESLSGYCGGFGCLRVLDGDGAGWAEIDKAGLYQAWATRLQARAYDADPRTEKGARGDLDVAASAYVHAEAIGAGSWRKWLDERFRAIDEGDKSLGGKSMNPLVGLVAHFATGKDANALEKAGWAALGPYAKVVDGAFSAGDYEELAEYHARRTVGAGFPDFDLYPYRLVPFELLALRRRTGIRVEDPRHPLLTSALFVERDVGEPPIPDELQAVLDRARNEFPL